jgi:hypothetical protein
LIISNGSYQPIDTYAKTTSSAYPIYTDPTCQLHKILRFKSALKEQGDGEEKRDYMQDAGTAMSRVFGGIKAALGDIKNTPYIGPKAQNGGEVIITAGSYRSSITLSDADSLKMVIVSTCIACRTPLTTRTLQS